jgi:hypothetical protein
MAKANGVEMTPEEKKAEELREQKKKERAEAKERVRKLIEDNKFDEQTKKDLQTLISFKKGRAGASNKVSKTDVLKKLFREKKTVSEMEIFKQFKMGIPEMNIQRRLMIQRSTPEDRVWINHDPEKEVWVMVKEGPNPPKDWDGYIPEEQKK